MDTLLLLQVSGDQNALMTFLPLVGVGLVAYFLLFMPQKKREKEMKKKLDAMQKGDKVVSIGGIVGTVSYINDDEVTIKVDDNAKITFKKKAIAEITSASKNSEVTATDSEKEAGK